MNKPKLNQPDGESITINKTIPSKQFEDIFVTSIINKYQGALNRIDAYRVNKSLKLNIKDILTLQELVDKATPKKVEKIAYMDIYGNELAKSKSHFYNGCPNCKGNVGIDANYCRHCGQAVDWSDKNE